MTDIFLLITNLSKSPELKDPSVQDKLAHLLVETESGLTTDRESVDNYSKKVVDFVRTAMEWYTVVPVS